MLFSEQRPVTIHRESGERGPILDRNGRILAMESALANISLWKPEVSDLPALCASLVAIPGLVDEDATDLAERILSAPGDFMYLRKRVDQSLRDAVAHARAEGKLPGVGIENIAARIYPEGALASHVVGFVGDDNKGLGGVELSFDRDLTAPEGERMGKQLFLTIDAEIQYRLESISRQTMKDNKAEAVMMMAMDSASGDILAWVSLPDYDPNDIRSSSADMRINRPSTWAYEPGSVFKIFSLAAILDLGGITPHDSWYCDGTYSRSAPNGETIGLSCLNRHGQVQLDQIIAYSCNVGTAYASDTVTSEALYRVIRDFGFGSRTDIPLGGESVGYLRPVDRWSLRSKPTIAIGQEIAVSALQIMQAASAIANEGILIRPRLVTKTLDATGTVTHSFPSEARRQVISKETAQTMLASLEHSLAPGGIGRRADIGDVRIGVKTGTAQLIDQTTGTYSKDDFIASCIGFIPADEPQIIVYQVVVKPKSDSIFGSIIAAPAVKEAGSFLVDVLGIQRGRSVRVKHPGTIMLSGSTVPRIGELLPDFTGLSKKQLLPLLARNDINVRIEGSGWVVRQNPEAGSPVSEGMDIILELE